MTGAGIQSAQRTQVTGFRRPDAIVSVEATRETGIAVDTDLEISLVTQMVAREMNESLDGVMSLMKPSMLYADTVSVASTAVLTAEKYSDAHDWDRDSILDLAASWGFEVAFRAVADRFPSLPRDQIMMAAIAVTESGLVHDLSGEGLWWGIRRLRGEREKDDLAIEEEILRQFVESSSADRLAGDANAFLEQMRVAEESGIMVVRRPPMPLLATPENMVPVRDALDAELARDTFLGVDSYMAQELGLRKDLRTRQAPVQAGGALLGRLRGLEQADMEDILQLREEVSDSLVGLRAEIMKLSMALQPDVPEDVAERELKARFLQGVAPMIQELESQVLDTRVLKMLKDRAVKDGFFGRVVTETTAWLGLGVVVDAAKAGATVAAGFTATAEIAALLLGTASDYQKQSATNRSNPFYIFIAGKRLEPKTSVKRRRPRRHRRR